MHQLSQQMTMEKPRLLPLILKLLKEQGKAKFDFGTFRMVERKNGIYKSLYTGRVRKVPPYKALFFTASDTLRKQLKKQK